MECFEVRGVPLAMRQDGWWLTDANDRPQQRSYIGEAPWLRLLLLVIVIALADILIWQTVVGVSLALFGVALVSAAALVLQPQINRRRLAIGAMMALLSVLPIVEMVQPLSVLLFSIGIALTLVMIAGLKPDRLIKGALRLFWVGPFQSIADGWACATNAGSVRVEKSQISRAFIGWALPVFFAGIFLILFAAANPILDNWLLGLVPDALPEPNLMRGVFWFFVAILCWPAFILWRLKERLEATRHTVKQQGGSVLLNEQSIMRSLVLFNLLFAVQTGMDIVFLYGGGDLPDGMSYATYAHRGAYPLVVTALLAGVFALLSKPFAKSSSMLRILLLIWVVQNFALVLGSLVRLELYVSIYGLTHLRLAALVWMGLVAACLCVLWLQIQQDRSNSWMVLRGALLTGAVLYSCSFISFDRTITHYNLTHDVKVDKWYICSLGEAALPEIIEHTNLDPEQFCPPAYGRRKASVFEPADWREWGFRNWRVRRNLQSLTAEVVSP
jgi:hypothetical protein